MRLGTNILSRKHMIPMDKKSGPKGKFTLGQIVAGVIAALFLLFWCYFMLDGFGWVIE